MIKRIMAKRRDSQLWTVPYPGCLLSYPDPEMMFPWGRVQRKRMSERETHTDTHRHRHTYTERETHTQTHRHTHTHTHTHTHRVIDNVFFFKFQLS